VWWLLTFIETFSFVFIGEAFLIPCLDEDGCDDETWPSDIMKRKANHFFSNLYLKGTGEY
jgi:hypothetical protein